MIAKELFNTKNVYRDFKFKNFGYTNSVIPLTMSYLYDEKYLNELTKNKNIVGVITTTKLAEQIPQGIGIIISNEPMSLFYDKFIEVTSQKNMPISNISYKAIISEKSIISDYNVIIEDDVIIEEGSIIKEGVIIQKGSVVRSGAIIAGDGFEVKIIYGKQVVIPHDGKVIIGQNVDIGYNTCIDKGMFGRDTIIGDGTKIDNLCHIAHGVQIGKNTKIAAKAMIAGSCTIGANVWIGPGSNVSNSLEIGDNAKVTIGSTVLKNVEPNQIVTGYFAQEHKVFLRKYLNLFRK